MKEGQKWKCNNDKSNNLKVIIIIKMNVTWDQQSNNVKSALSYLIGNDIKVYYKI